MRVRLCCLSVCLFDVYDSRYLLLTLYVCRPADVTLSGILSRRQVQQLQQSDTSILTFVSQRLGVDAMLV